MGGRGAGLGAILKAMDEARKELPTKEQVLEALKVVYDPEIPVLPDYIKSTLQLDSLRQTAFSKFYLCRKYNI